MNIFLLRSGPANPDSRVEKEVDTLIKSGYNVKVIAWDRDQRYKAKDVNLNLNHGIMNIIRIGIPASFGAGFKSNLIPLLKFQIGLFKQLYKHRKRIDCIHACDFDTVIPALVISKIFKKKLVYDIFDYYIDCHNMPKYIRNFVKNFDEWAIKSADATIICSEKRKEQIGDSHPRKLYIIHNSPPKVNLKDQNKFNLDNAKVKIVYIGCLQQGRMINELIRICSKMNGFELHIGGFGDQKLESYIKQMSQENENIKFYGKLAYQDVLELEAASDIMLAIYDPKIPNHKYAAPNKFYEALMLGKPVIMARNTGMDFLVEKYDIGKVIEYNSESLRNALVELASIQSEWDNMSKRMKELYSKMFSWNEMERRLIDLYQNI